MPDPDSNGGGNPISNVAHGATSFWDQAAAATQGVASGQLWRGNLGGKRTTTRMASQCRGLVMIAAKIVARKSFVEG